MNVITLVDFHDNLRGVDRKRGEVFIASRERFEEINAVGESKIGKPLVGEVEEKKSPEQGAAKSCARRRRKAAE